MFFINSKSATDKDDREELLVECREAKKQLLQELGRCVDFESNNARAYSYLISDGVKPLLGASTNEIKRMYGIPYNRALMDYMPANVIKAQISAINNTIEQTSSIKFPKIEDVKRNYLLSCKAIGDLIADDFDWKNLSLNTDTAKADYQKIIDKLRKEISLQKNKITGLQAELDKKNDALKHCLSVDKILERAGEFVNKEENAALNIHTVRGFLHTILPKVSHPRIEKTVKRKPKPASPTTIINQDIHNNGTVHT